MSKSTKRKALRIHNRYQRKTAAGYVFDLSRRAPYDYEERYPLIIKTLEKSKESFMYGGLIELFYIERERFKYPVYEIYANNIRIFKTDSSLKAEERYEDEN